MFNVVSSSMVVIIMSIFALVVAITFVVLGINMRQNSYFRRQPLVTTDAKVCDKRTKIRGQDHIYTDYYITFEFEDGFRDEMQVDGEQFKVVKEGDVGKLSYQGRRFLSYLRL